nr:TPA_inf: conotoxin precursor SF-mi1 [Conus judaeus]
MSKTGIVLVVLYLLSSPVNLQQNGDDKAFSKIESPTLTRVLRICHTCSMSSGRFCVGTCCHADYACRPDQWGCGCVLRTDH